uniref:DRBM domain-containing protein n=1 Tax=Hippocampus comes TaxID=109280 RepID=A0A3Q2XXF9_HIPCM
MKTCEGGRVLILQRPGLRYDAVSQTGPPHAPVFAVSVDVNGLRFEGRGSTKKQAKTRAAELALKSFAHRDDHQASTRFQHAPNQEPM